MQTEKGEPAFENIDILLADKIIEHTTASADIAEKQKTEYDEYPEPAQPRNRRLVFWFISILLGFAVIWLIRKLISKSING